MIGFLNSESPDLFAYLVLAFRQGLSQSGYVEGSNVAIEDRWAHGQYDRLPAWVGRPDPARSDCDCRETDSAQDRPINQRSTRALVPSPPRATSCSDRRTCGDADDASPSIARPSVRARGWAAMASCSPLAETGHSGASRSSSAASRKQAENCTTYGARRGR